jgi:protein-tyrosine phosphatase
MHALGTPRRALLLFMKIIDFHSHILPQADHGSDSLETTVIQLEYSRRAFVDVIVATPHFYPHRHNVKGFLERRSKALSLVENLTDRQIPKIIAGAEVLLCEEMNRLPDLGLLCIENTNTLLIELPFNGISQRHYDAIEKIMENHEVLLAHADRYERNIIERFIALGAKLQLNVDSIAKLFSKKHLFEWIDGGIVSALGSDIHMRDKTAYASFVRAKGKLKDNFEIIMSNSAKILNL